MGYMEATECLKYPYLITRDTSPSRAVLEVFRFSSSDGGPATAPYLASTQALRSQRVSSASKISDCVVAHQSDWSGAAAAPSSVLRSWLCGLTKEPSGFLVNNWKPRELGVASARLPRSPGSTLVLRLYQETIHDFILLFMPPCSLNLTPLATGSLERGLIVFSTPGGLTSDDLSRLLFTCTNTSQAAACTCNT
jgi:hypothetical protein